MKLHFLQGIFQSFWVLGMQPRNNFVFSINMIPLLGWIYPTLRNSSLYMPPSGQLIMIS